MEWADGIRRGIGELVVRLVGWLGDEDLPRSATWPPPWPVPKNSPESVDILVRWLGLSEEQYHGACRLAEEMVEEAEFKEAVSLVARALMVAPHIDAEGLAILREAAGFPEPEAAPA